MKSDIINFFSRTFMHFIFLLYFNTVISYYNPPNKALNHQIFNELEKLNEKYILLRDLNAKTEALGCSLGNENGIILEQILTQNDSVVFNNKEHTYRKFNSNVTEILYLVICSPSLFKHANIFRIFDESYLGSD